MKGLGTHIELVRELGLERRIRRSEPHSEWRAARDILVGSVIGFGIVGMVAMGLVAIDRIGR